MRGGLSFRQPSGMVPPAPGQTLEQVWFTGAHSDVGGGEPDDLAGNHRSLRYYAGLDDVQSQRFRPGVRRGGSPMPLDPALALDTFHESWKVFNGVPIRRKIADNSSIANSVVVRCSDRVHLAS